MSDLKCTTRAMQSIKNVIAKPALVWFPSTSEAAIFQVSVFTPEYAGMLFRILEFYSEVLEVYIEGLECQSYRSECGLELPLTFGS
jgi:hypothetical protein